MILDLRPYCTVWVWVLIRSLFDSLENDCGAGEVSYTGCTCVVSCYALGGYLASCMWAQITNSLWNGKCLEELCVRGFEGGAR